MINTFIIEGKIKEIKTSIKMNKFVLIENENESGRLCLIRIYLSDKLAAVLNGKCDIDDLICVQGHIENVFILGNKIEYIFIADKVTTIVH